MLRFWMKPVDLCRHFPTQEKNWEIYREFFEFDAEIAELCPKYANLVQKQGINSEFPLLTLMNKRHLLPHLS